MLKRQVSKYVVKQRGSYWLVGDAEGVVVLYMGERPSREEVLREAGELGVSEDVNVVYVPMVYPRFETPTHVDKPELKLGVPAPVGIELEARVITPEFATPPQIGQVRLAGEVERQAYPLEAKPKLPIFQNPVAIERVVLNAEVPKAAATSLVAVPLPTFMRPSQVAALVYNAHVPGADADVDFDPLELLLGAPASRLVGERAVVVLAKKTRQDYLELLKRVLRELYRVGVGGLPTPIDVLTNEDFEVKKPLIKAGGSICVIDVENVCKKEDSKGIDKKSCLEFIAGRVREAYSQGLGYLVLYGGDFAELKKWISVKVVGEEGFEAPLQRYVEVEGGADPRLVGLMFAGSPQAADIDVGQYAMYLDVMLSKAVEAAAREYAPYVKRGVDESLMHYGLKALVVKYLEKRGIKLEDIETEYIHGISSPRTMPTSTSERTTSTAAMKQSPSEILEKEHDKEYYIFDVYVKSEGLAVEVETLYGTVVPVAKLMETGEKAGAVKRLWIVIPPPQLFLFLKDVLKARKALRRRFMQKGADAVEFYTIDLFKEELIPIPEYVNRLKKVAKRQTAK